MNGGFPYVSFFGFKFEVFHNLFPSLVSLAKFQWFLDPDKDIWTCSEAFQYVRMHSDTLGYVLWFSATLRKHRFLDKFGESGFWEVT